MEQAGQIQNHAIEQVASFDSGTRLGNTRLKNGVNALLPPDIRIMSVKMHRMDFMRVTAPCGKIYLYYCKYG